MAPAFGVLARLAALLLRRTPAKRLEATVLGRGIVAELPYDAPCRLIDRDGNEIRNGVYVLAIRLWNRGTLAVFAADFAPSAPLRIRLEPRVRVLDVDTVSPVEGLCCDAWLESDGVVGIRHEGFNPGDDAIVSVYYTGADIYAPVSVEGRIVGQTVPLDRTDNEGRASFAERLAPAVLLTWGMLSVLALPICAYLIGRDYGLRSLWRTPEQLPPLLVAPFFSGLMFVMLVASSWLLRWIERRNHPKGFPLASDLEPPIWISLKVWVRMIVTGRRYRISASLFSVGEPVLMTRKGVRRRSVDDWIR